MIISQLYAATKPTLSEEIQVPFWQETSDTIY